MTCEPGPGPIDPYKFYIDEVEPNISTLNSIEGTINYFDFYESIIEEVESKREKYLKFLPGMMIGTAMLKIIFDYYRSLNYETEDTDGTEIDEQFNIDLVAMKENEIIVTQVKSGEISEEEIKKFCTKAPEYIVGNQSHKELKKLVVLAYRMGHHADETFIEYGKKLQKEGFVLIRLLPETIANELPKYKRHFKELTKIHTK